MLLLLRRALAQLRGDPPESWPNALRAEQPAPVAPYGPEWYGPVYPIPTLNLQRLLPGLSAIYGLPLHCKCVFASGSRIGLRTIYPASGCLRRGGP